MVLNAGQGKAKKTRKFAEVKRIINTKKDVRWCVQHSPVCQPCPLRLMLGRSTFKDRKKSKGKDEKEVRHM